LDERFIPRHPLKALHVPQVDDSEAIDPEKIRRR